MRTSIHLLELLSAVARLDCSFCAVGALSPCLVAVRAPSAVVRDDNDDREEERDWLERAESGLFKSSALGAGNEFAVGEGGLGTIAAGAGALNTQLCCSEQTFKQTSMRRLPRWSHCTEGSTRRAERGLVSWKEIACSWHIKHQSDPIWRYRDRGRAFESAAFRAQNSKSLQGSQQTLSICNGLRTLEYAMKYRVLPEEKLTNCRDFLAFCVS